MPISISKTATEGDTIIVDCIGVAGDDAFLPRVCIPVKLFKELHAPMDLTLPLSMMGGHNACVTDEGLVLVTGDPGVLIFDARGAQQPSLNNAAISSIQTVALAYDTTSDVLFTCELDDRAGARILAVDMATGNVRWESDPVLNMCYCLATLPHAGIVVGGSDGSKEIHAVDMSGTLVSSHHCDESVFAASDSSTNTVYVSSTKGYVEAFVWDMVGRSFLSTWPHREYSVFQRLSPSCSHAPIPGGHIAHLVVGCWGTDIICVLSLPSLVLIGRTVSGCGDLEGLAADAAGTAMIMFSGGSAHVRPWPLPGLPPLA